MQCSCVLFFEGGQPLVTVAVRAMAAQVHGDDRDDERR